MSNNNNVTTTMELEKKQWNKGKKMKSER